MSALALLDSLAPGGSIELSTPTGERTIATGISPSAVGGQAAHGTNAVAGNLALATTISFDSPAFVSAVAQVVVVVVLTFNTTAAGAQSGTLNLRRDGATQIGSTNPQQWSLDAGTPGTVITLVWIDTIVAGSSHTWGVTASVTAGGGSIQSPTGTTTVSVYELH